MFSALSQCQLLHPDPAEDSEEEEEERGLVIHYCMCVCVRVCVRACVHMRMYI